MGSSFAASQTTKQNVASERGKQHLRMVVILSRHGVRSPTWTQDRLDAYSAQPWPKWSVPPGNLTPRGFELIRLFGSYDRAALAENSLLSAHGCADASETYIWADTDQRTLESGRALAKGLFPDCPPEVHSLATGMNDPIFHPHAKELRNADPISTTPNRDTQTQQLLIEMQHLLQGCDVTVACTPTSAPAMPLFGSSVSMPQNNSSQSQDTLALAASFSEDLLLEYTDGMPMEQVGWGKVDEAQLRRFLVLHTANFDRSHRTPVQAKLEASNLLLHIERTLQQHIERRPVIDAVGPVKSKLVLLTGHDTNIAGVAALIGLHWTLDGRKDDTPPGTQLAFELWQNEHGDYSVRVNVAMQTLQQMRDLQPLTPSNPPVGETLRLSECDAVSKQCQWQSFLKMVNHAVDKNNQSPADAN
jgi:4-phytase/acid phosphatase